MKPKDIAMDFVNAINEHNVNKILSLMTDDHIFIDAYGIQRIKPPCQRVGPDIFNGSPTILLRPMKFLKMEIQLCFWVMPEVRTKAYRPMITGITGVFLPLGKLLFLMAR